MRLKNKLYPGENINKFDPFQALVPYLTKKNKEIHTNKCF